MIVNKFSCDQNLKQYTDSMLFDSGTDIAFGEFEINGKIITVSLEVRGEVSVIYQGIKYRSPSEFPDKLINLIQEYPYNWDISAPSGEGNDEPEIYIDMGNWFEYMVGENNTFVEGFVCETDISKCNKEDILNDMKEYAKWFATN